jgi:hypothetical protein
MKIKLILLLLLSTSATGDEIYAQDGTYLGKLGGSPYQYDSTANPGHILRCCNQHRQLIDLMRLLLQDGFEALLAVQCLGRYASKGY